MTTKNHYEPQQDSRTRVGNSSLSIALITIARTSVYTYPACGHAFGGLHSQEPGKGAFGQGDGGREVEKGIRKMTTVVLVLLPVRSQLVCFAGFLLLLLLFSFVCMSLSIPACATLKYRGPNRVCHSRCYPRGYRRNPTTKAIQFNTSNFLIVSSMQIFVRSVCIDRLGNDLLIVHAEQRLIEGNNCTQVPHATSFFYPTLLVRPKQVQPGISETIVGKWY